VQRNVRQVTADGVQIIQPGTGWLSCRQQGAGRMAEPEEIAGLIRDLLTGVPAKRSS
jgi:phosphopantothenoylcysteine decarboxylase/phosphopantothenate--cysteine ligase